MIITLENSESKVSIEHEYLDNDMCLDEVFNTLVEPALLGIGFQRGSILDVCEEYLLENSMEFISDEDGMIEEEEEEEEGVESKINSKCSNYTTGYDRGYQACKADNLEDRILEEKAK